MTGSVLAAVCRGLLGHVLHRVSPHRPGRALSSRVLPWRPWTRHQPVPTLQEVRRVSVTWEEGKVSDVLSALGGKGRTPLPGSPGASSVSCGVPQGPTGSSASEWLELRAQLRPRVPVPAAGALRRMGARVPSGSPRAAPRRALGSPRSPRLRSSTAARRGRPVCSTTGRFDRVPPQPKTFRVPRGFQIRAKL